MLVIQIESNGRWIEQNRASLGVQPDRLSVNCRYAVHGVRWFEASNGNARHGDPCPEPAPLLLKVKPFPAKQDHGGKKQAPEQQGQALRQTKTLTFQS